MDNAAQLVWDAAAELGEGPVWVERDQALWFTDIKRQKIHRFEPASGDRLSWDSPGQAGFILPAASGGFVAGLQSGLHHFDPGSGAFDLIVEVEPDRPANRLNDGVVDPEGRIWFGTMDNSERARSGAFYCFDRGRLVRTDIEGIAITNGPAISPDGRTVYWVDTLAGRVSACEIEGSGVLGPSRPVVRIDPKEGHADGPSVDAEGCIWIGLYAGWEARRYSPDGELLDRMRFPVSNITKVALGGPNLKTAFVTTARHLLRPEELERQPQAGGLFAFPASVRGLPSHLAAL